MSFPLPAFPFKRPGRLDKRALGVIALLAIALAGGVWYALDYLEKSARQALLCDLPAPPDLTDRVSELQEEVRRLDAEVRSDPQSLDTLAALAMTYHAAECYRQAAACYQMLEQRAPQDERWPYYRAVALEAEFDFDTAIALLQRVGEMKPGYAHTWARLGDLYRKQGNLQEARSAYDRALTLEPLHPNATLGLAYLLAHEQKWELVVDVLEPLLEENPLFAPATRQLAHACERLGREPPVIEMADPEAAMENIINEPLLDAVYDYSVLGLLKGNPDQGAEIVVDRCTRCHSTERIAEAQKNAIEWRRTVRRMQSVAGRSTLGDQDAADILAYLVEHMNSSATATSSADEPESSDLDW